MLRSHEGTNVMPSKTNRTSILSAGFVLVAIVAIAACGTGAASPDPTSPSTPAPSVTPSADPTVAPTPASTPTPAPSAPADGTFTFDLDVADAHAVSAVLTDGSDRITAATSGKAGDGMSVRWSDIEIVNVDRDTLRITFVGYPQDEVIGLDFDVAAGDGFNLLVTQKLPLPNTDALGADRVVVLDFHGDVDASDVYAAFVAA
jgi:hypothetical protein